MTDKKEKHAEKKDEKFDLHDRLARVEHALASGFNVNLEHYDTAAIIEAREAALTEAAERAKAEIEKALAESRSVKLTDAERIDRLEKAIGHALGREL